MGNIRPMTKNNCTIMLERRGSDLKYFQAVPKPCCSVGCELRKDNCGILEITKKIPNKLKQFSQKTALVPAMAITIPAILGPITRERWKLTAFIAKACWKSSRGTTAGVILLNAGRSKAMIVPSMRENATSCHICTCPVLTMTPRQNATRLSKACVIMRMLRIPLRSAKTPAKGANKILGTAEANKTTASAELCPTILRTTQLFASSCIQFPTNDTNCAPIKKRKSLCLNGEKRDLMNFTTRSSVGTKTSDGSMGD